MQTQKNIKYLVRVEACVAERLTPRTLDLEVWGSSLPRLIQVYKWVLVTYCWGVTFRWTCLPSRGQKQYTLVLFGTETGISSGRVPPPPPPGRQSGCKGLKSGTRIQSARLAHIPHYPIAFSGDLSSLFSRLHLNSQEKILSWDSEYPEVSASLDNACTVDYRLTQRRRGFHSHRTTRVDGFILSAQ